MTSFDPHPAAREAGPRCERVRARSTTGLAHLAEGLLELPQPALYEEARCSVAEGHIAAEGPFVVGTGSTRRAPLRQVRYPRGDVEEKVWWGAHNRTVSRSQLHTCSPVCRAELRGRRCSCRTAFARRRPRPPAPIRITRRRPGHSLFARTDVRQAAHLGRVSEARARVHGHPAPRDFHASRADRQHAHRDVHHRQLRRAASRSSAARPTPARSRRRFFTCRTTSCCARRRRADALLGQRRRGRRRRDLLRPLGNRQRRRSPPIPPPADRRRTSTAGARAASSTSRTAATRR